MQRLALSLQDNDISISFGQCMLKGLVFAPADERSHITTRDTHNIDKRRPSGSMSDQPAVYQTTGAVKQICGSDVSSMATSVRKGRMGSPVCVARFKLVPTCPSPHGRSTTSRRRAGRRALRHVGFPGSDGWRVCRLRNRSSPHGRTSGIREARPRQFPLPGIPRKRSVF